MLIALAEYMTDARAVVTYNGKAFDIPLLNNRYILHGLISPFKDLAHIDLLPMARKIWKKKLASRVFPMWKLKFSVWSGLWMKFRVILFHRYILTT